MNIKRERRKRGWSQEELANMLGVSRGTIVNYENDGVIPVSKRPILDRIFGKSEDDDIDSKLLFLENNGVKIPVKELAVFFIENQEVFMQNKVLRTLIDKLIAEKLNEKLQEIILDLGLKK
ncbi:MAG: helix-turn-helix domain-containing protein [Flavobacteriaceae bacterium]|nr:helix-turn-helix domain-containing protein [Flavobacteriaceae bacterium]